MAVESGQERPCKLCGGRIGKAIGGGLMCYGCGPWDMIPRDTKLSPEDLLRRDVHMRDLVSDSNALVRRLRKPDGR